MSAVDKMNQAYEVYEKSGKPEDYETYKALYNEWAKTWTPKPYPYED